MKLTNTWKHLQGGCAVGWTWSGSEFIPPPDPEDPATSAPAEATP